EGVRLRVAQDEDIVQRERDEPHEADEREAKRRSPSVPSQDDRRERHRAQWRHEQRAVTEPLRDRRDDPKGGLWRGPFRPAMAALKGPPYGGFVDRPCGNRREEEREECVGGIRLQLEKIEGEPLRARAQHDEDRRADGW